MLSLTEGTEHRKSFGSLHVLVGPGTCIGTGSCFPELLEDKMGDVTG